ncbi:MAG TPA: bifunctional YncE family protein/alkaline phosphatase family protein [Chthonomonadaceae bacterium]|nr:bifunctional YncE family protein/alkaline phosphatase family protein [Chthonomonadaceae bacterium]
MRAKLLIICATLICIGGACLAAMQAARLRVGIQPDHSAIVSSLQRVEPASVAFDGRPVDIALHPSGQFFAVLNQKSVLLATRDGVIAGSSAPLHSGAGFHGLVWSPDGARLYASVSDGFVESFDLAGRALTPHGRIDLRPADSNANPRPGGMAITRDGTRLYVAAMDRDAVVEVDTAAEKRTREYAVQKLPFDAKLSEDERSLVVSNWGGRPPRDDDEMAATGSTMIGVDPRGAAANGSVTVVRLATGNSSSFPVGLHPTGIAVQGNRAYVADAASDDIAVVDISAAALVRKIPLKWGKLNLFGSMPCALAAAGKALYVCNGGDNALCEIDAGSGTVRGFRPAGYYPMGVAISADGKSAFVVNTKGNGSTRRTSAGQPGNAHDFQGTMSVIDLGAPIGAATERVAADNGWNRDRKALKPDLAVYTGAIEHVLYIIKENRTYDEVLGDLPQGSGDASLCDLGRTITPNAHALADQFTLFDNAYCAGTNSADGHAWCTQSIANDYLEHFYTGYRTYPDDADCAMGISNTGFLWNAALKRGKTLRDYGEAADDELAVFTPTVKSWLEVWKDRLSGRHRIQTSVNTRIAALRPYLHPRYVYWPLLQSDQERADLFLGEYAKFSREDRVPNLMLLTLPCDHTEGRDPNYPKPQSMVADNDLALGRIVDAVSHSPQWKHTCIFVIEDDAQNGMDHVDGHRTVFFAFSPFVRRKFVDHSLYNTCSMVRSIEMMLGLDPMNRFDALTPPLAACFQDRPDYTPYTVRPSQIPLDDMNPQLAAQLAAERAWTRRSLALDWSGPDRADPATLNAILWHTLHGSGGATPLHHPLR